MSEPIHDIKPPLLPDWHSPVQEHHIDFLLEEEFASNPAFLQFVLDAVKLSAQSCWPSGLPPASCDPSCFSVRSVTTDKGETDVLVIYNSTTDFGRVAILIEDKIRAGFQEQQAERYRMRGEDGKNSGEWDHFWTCLVAPARYAPSNTDFDARISLETLKTFFDVEDVRSRFKADVLGRAIQHFTQTGLQIVDETVTQFRSFYSTQAAAFFEPGEIGWPEPRDAWSGDTWFNFRRGPLPKGVEIVHKAPSGFVDLAFWQTRQEVLAKALAQCDGEKDVVAVQTGKSASLRLKLEKITDFKCQEQAKPTVLKAFEQVRRLTELYQKHKAILP